MIEPWTSGNEGSARARRDVHLVQHGIRTEGVGGHEAVPIADRAAGAVIFQRFAVIRVRHINRRGAADRLRLAPALRVVSIGCKRVRRRRAGAAGQDRNEAAFRVVTIVETSIVGEIAIAIVGRTDRSDRSVLVEGVGGVADIRRRGRIAPPAVVGRALADTPVDGVVPEGEARAGGGRRRLAWRRSPACGRCQPLVTLCKQTRKFFQPRQITDLLN